MSACSWFVPSATAFLSASATVDMGPTAYDGVVQYDGDMQQNSCRVELIGPSVELDDRGLARVRRIIYEVPKSLE